MPIRRIILCAAIMAPLIAGAQWPQYVKTMGNVSAGDVVAFYDGSGRYIRSVIGTNTVSPGSALLWTGSNTIWGTVAAGSVAFADVTGLVHDNAALVSALALKADLALLSGYIATSGVVAAWTNNGGTFSASTNCVLGVLSNGVYDLDYDISGTMIATPQMSADGTNWLSLAPTNGSVYLRLSISSPPAPGDNTVTVSNIVAWTWSNPTIALRNNDTIGQRILVDTPTAQRHAANKAYVDALVGAINPALWANYAASTNVRLDGHALQVSAAYSIVAVSSNGSMVIRHNGRDLLIFETGTSGCMITNAVIGTNIVLSVATNDVSDPWPEWCDDLVIGSWQIVAGYALATNGALYELSFSNVWQAAYFRVMQAGTNSSRITATVPIHAPAFVGPGTGLTEITAAQITGLPEDNLAWTNKADSTDPRIVNSTTNVTGGILTWADGIIGLTVAAITNAIAGVYQLAGDYWMQGDSVTNAVDETARSAIVATSNAIPTAAEQVGAVSTGATITVNGVTSNLADNPSFTITEGITAATATGIAESVVAPWTNQVTAEAIAAAGGLTNSGVTVNGVALTNGGSVTITAGVLFTNFTAIPSPSASTAGRTVYCTDSPYVAVDNGAEYAFYVDHMRVYPPSTNGWSFVSSYGGIIDVSRGFVEITGSNAYSIALTTNLPPTPYSIEACIGNPINMQRYSGAGLTWSDGTKYLPVYFTQDGTTTDGYLPIPQKWSDINTFSASYTSLAPKNKATDVFWLKLTDDGTNRASYVSSRGNVYRLSQSISRTDYATPSTVGVFVRPYGADQTNQISFSIYSLRLTSP